MTITLEQLAIRLYEAELLGQDSIYDANKLIEPWIKLFTKDELIKLWEGCQKDLDTPYDDEIYNALERMGYFK